MCSFKTDECAKACKQTMSKNIRNNVKYEIIINWLLTYFGIDKDVHH